MAFTLRYEGANFDSQGNFVYPRGDFQPDAKITQNQKLAKKFSNIGALVIRYHLGHGQRAGLIQQIARQNYAQNPVEKPAHGADEENVLGISIGATPTCQATNRLERCAHATLGRCKVLNERAQPLVHTNSANLKGEQHLWAIMHSNVWNTGINFSSQLNSQGFVYLSCPKDITAEEYDRISKALANGKAIEIKEGHYKIEGIDREFKACPISRVSIDLDPEKKDTFQDNGLVITPLDKPEERAPLGWLVHKASGKALSHDLFSNAACVMKLAKGGFYELSNPQQVLLQSGLIKNNGMGLFTQNQAFNAIVVIADQLEKEFGFDPEKLMGTSLTTSYKRVQEFFKDPEHLEDFLTGPLLTEMVQSLRVTRNKSTRKELPIRFTNPFKVTLNNTKAIAYAFGISDLNKEPVFIPDPKAPFSEDHNLIDVSVNGNLKAPSLTYGKHAASVLSTAMLVAEQMVLEQHLRDAINTDTVEDLISKITGNYNKLEVTALAQTLINAAKYAPRDENGPILGLQFPHCDTMVGLLRTVLGFDILLDLNTILERDGMMTDAAVSEFLAEHPRGELLRALKNLSRIANFVQNDEGTTGRWEHSRGIHAGLTPLLMRIAPSLVKELGLEKEIARVPDAPPIEKWITWLPASQHQLLKHMFLLHARK